MDRGNNTVRLWGKRGGDIAFGNEKNELEIVNDLYIFKGFFIIDLKEVSNYILHIRIGQLNYD